jgi:Leishmanolysin/Bacterial Ig-like domain (group 2)
MPVRFLVRSTPGNMATIAAACGGLVLWACKGTEPFVPVPTAVLVTPDTVVLTSLGATKQFSAIVLDQRGDTIPASPVTWASTDLAVATIDSTGLLTAVGVGGVEVQATAATASAPPAGTADVAVTQLPSQLQRISGDQQTDTVAQTLPAPLVVLVNDALSHPIPGVVVTFMVTQGGGSASAAADTTDAAGRASVAWTLGATAGLNNVSASIAGPGVNGNPATFTAFGVVPGSSPSVARYAGDAQTGLVGFAVNVPPAVLVRNASGTPQAGVAVTFTVTGGGGALVGGVAVTDTNGVASVGSWSLTAGANSLTATVEDPGPYLGNPLTFTATGAAAAYHIDVRFLTPMTASQRAAFNNAAAKWESLIFGDVPDTPITLQAGGCGTDSPALSETIDDIVIFASIDSIDGRDKILGQAGPCVVRGGSRLPLVGEMEFDSADVVSLQNAGQFDLVIEHEMGHVLGYGTIWSTLGLLAGSSTMDPSFTGVQALAAFDRIGGSTYTGGAKVPVEDCCGSGTRNAHWRESVLGHELMTGFLNAGANPLSVLTTASMGDLGYLVNDAGSDPFTVTLALQAQPGAVLALGNDILRLPISVVDLTGRVVRVLPPP